MFVVVGGFSFKNLFNFFFFFQNIFGVIVGGVIGHSICTGLAVLGGRMIAQKISVRTVTIVGGIVFILFALSALFFSPNDEEPIKIDS